jgi:hypothetical protein
MRIWDINPGYLNRQSLLGEHRELHGIVSINTKNKKGYSRHPETLRWNGYGWALRQRHLQLSAEMALRGYVDHTPVRTHSNRNMWPIYYIDEPIEQFEILNQKYQGRDAGRIPLPKNAQQLWSQHKYSILARDVSLYKRLGREVSTIKSRQGCLELARLLVEQLRKRPSYGGLRNTLLHMWGYVSDSEPGLDNDIESLSSSRLLKEIQNRTMSLKEPYLITSTALGEFTVWLR